VYRLPVLSTSSAVSAVKIWKVPTSQTSPEGVDYSLSLIFPEGDRIVGYDNHWPKGHHRYVLEQEETYAYRGIDP
jgi:hypothetical protein